MQSGEFVAEKAVTGESDKCIRRMMFKVTREQSPKAPLFVVNAITSLKIFMLLKEWDFSLGM